MRLIDIIGSDGIIPRLAARERDEAIFELVDRLVENGQIKPDHREDIMMAILKREALGATSIGNGVAIPHVKTDRVNAFVGVLARSRDGIEFAPGEPQVNLIILFLSPARAVSGHLRLLAHIGGILKHEGFVKSLCDAEGKAQLLDLVRDAERMIFGEDQGGGGGKQPPPEEGGQPALLVP